MNYVVIDLEYNQAFDYPTGKKVKSNPKCPFEIIQIGAVRLNDKFELLGHHSFLAKPSIYKRMHPYVSRITGLKIKDFAGAPDFPAAFSEFLAFAGDKPTLCVWGKSDITILRQNLKFYGIDWDLPTDFINVQALTSIYLHKPVSVNLGLKNMVRHFELAENLDYHDALNDAVYTASLFKIISTTSSPAPSIVVN